MVKWSSGPSSPGVVVDPVAVNIVLPVSSLSWDSRGHTNWFLGTAGCLNECAPKLTCGACPEDALPLVMICIGHRARAGCEDCGCQVYGEHGPGAHLRCLFFPVLLSNANNLPVTLVLTHLMIDFCLTF